jgi:hypothetical protein
MHCPVTSWGNTCSKRCVQKPVRCMYWLVMSQADYAITAWALLFLFCLGYTFTPATLQQPSNCKENEQAQVSISVI